MLNSPENDRRLVKSEIDRKYPRLTGAVARVSKVTMELFRPLRPDVEKLIPPLLLCDTEKLQKEADRAYRKTTREDKPEERGKLQLEISSGTIFASNRHFQKILSIGQKGFDFLTVALAEEYVHALTAFEENGATRLGFLHIPYPRILHSLEPGKIYEHNVEIISDEAPLLIEDPREIRLTENFTRLAVYLMFDKLLPECKKKFSWICAYNPETKPQIIQPNDNLLNQVIKSLVRGDETMIVADAKQENLLKTLDTPKTKIYGLYKIPPESPDDLYDTTISPIEVK